MEERKAGVGERQNVNMNEGGIQERRGGIHY